MVAAALANNHILLGSLFLFLFVLSGWRFKNHADTSGSGRIISIFYVFIILATLLRGLWLLIFVPFASGSKHELKYSILSLAFVDDNWLTILFSSVIKALGTICIYSIFLLVLCFWSHIVKRIDEFNHIAIASQNNLKSTAKSSFDNSNSSSSSSSSSSSKKDVSRESLDFGVTISEILSDSPPKIQQLPETLDLNKSIYNRRRKALNVSAVTQIKHLIVSESNDLSESGRDSNNNVSHDTEGVVPAITSGPDTASATNTISTANISSSTSLSSSSTHAYPRILHGVYTAPDSGPLLSPELNHYMNGSPDEHTLTNSILGAHNSYTSTRRSLANPNLDSVYGHAPVLLGGAVENTSLSEDNHRISRFLTDPVSHFFAFSVIIFVLELLNYFFFLFQLFKVGESIAFDSFLSVSMSIFIVYMIFFYFQKLQSLKKYNNDNNNNDNRKDYKNDNKNDNNSDSIHENGLFREFEVMGLKIESIKLFAVGSTMFFAFRCLLDFYFGVIVLLYIKTVELRTIHFIITPAMWNSYINAQYGSELAIIAFILLLSSTGKNAIGREDIVNYDRIQPRNINSRSNRVRNSSSKFGTTGGKSATETSPLLESSVV